MAVSDGKREIGDFALSLMRASDIEQLTPLARQAVESAYRRGYTQGAWSALIAAGKAGHDGILLDSPFDRWYRRLMAWRSGRVKGAKAMFPPEFGSP